ncbi:hypothetical protein [Peribacillus sp. FSL M8-0224]|nr:hypothetical protein KY492_20295 [Brevibacterium sp. PAMC21349]
MRNRKNELWAAIEKELTLSSDGAYSIDMDTGSLLFKKKQQMVCQKN